MASCGGYFRSQGLTVGLVQAFVDGNFIFGFQVKYAAKQRKLLHYSTSLELK
jgi:hypothetical protein